MLAAAEVVLQSILLPGLAFGAPEAMYVRLHNDRCRAELKNRVLVLGERGRASFDTFFNGLTIDMWRRHCALDDLRLVLAGSGTLVVRLGTHRLGHGHRWLDERTVTLKDGEPAHLAIDAWPNLTGGMLYFAVEALGPAMITGGAFATRTPPRRPVRLGLVITHYDRKRHLLPAVARLNAELLGDPGLSIDLVIVDNSRDVAPAEVPGAILLPNPNLGGSGGFMRGLLHVAEIGATHCLFMDDDASCETDSIRRAHALLQYAGTEKFAIAGGLLRALEPHRLFEKGACFDLVCLPQKSGLDMTHVGDLLAAELDDRRPDYGGWWFLAFAITDISRYAFPFFVRGDDILFCVQNELAIRTVNGIACWGEDFAFKHSPMTTYLDTRNHLVQELARAAPRRLAALRVACRFFFFSAFSYNYASAQVVTLALSDVAAGPRFWRDNLDLAACRAHIRAVSAAETLRPIERARHRAVPTSPCESRLRRLARLLTLNGFLIPAALLKSTTAYQPKSFFGTLRGVFRHKTVLYEYEPLGIGYIAVHDKRRFFRELMNFLRVLARFATRFASIRRAYAQALPEMTSANFWKQIYAARGDVPRRDREPLDAPSVRPVTGWAAPP